MKRIKDYNNRVTLVDLYSVGCSDQHLTWGFSTFKIGRLYYDPTDDIYVWRGHFQGRHGDRWNENSEYHFKVEKGEIIEVWTNKDRKVLPVKSEFEKSLQTLRSLIKNSNN